jgi:hypothetical protein
MGWEFEPLPPYLSRKHVIIGFPHTSNMDAVRAFIGYRIIKRTGHIMVKKEWFFWPMSVVLKIIGISLTGRSKCCNHLLMLSSIRLSEMSITDRKRVTTR